MALIRIAKLGMFDGPEAQGAKPFWVALEIEEGKPPILQAMTRSAFFNLVNGMVKPTAQACGMTHVQSVSVPDDEIVRAKKERADLEARGAPRIVRATH
jgi:hypothetical protein